jgi:hypothetical protein
VKKNKNRLKFKKNRPVWFGFINLKPKKPNPNKKKPKKNRAKPEKNRAKPEKPSQTGLNRFCHENRTEPKPVSV